MAGLSFKLYVMLCCMHDAHVIIILCVAKEMISCENKAE
jgi:hypothetical protein